MTSAKVAIFTGIRSQLLTSSDLVTRLTGSDGVTRVYRLNAPGGTAGVSTYPYVRMRIVSGGEENAAPSRSFDAFVVVEAIGKQQADLEELDDLIELALKDSYPVYGGGWKAHTPVTYISPVSDVLIIQQIQFYAEGAQYRVRAIK